MTESLWLDELRIIVSCQLENGVVTMSGDLAQN